MNRQRALSAFIMLCVLAILLVISYLRFEHSSTQLRSQIRDLTSVSRVVYYRVQNQAGPRFRLAGGEQAVRLISHFAVERSAAWPVSQYRPQLRYPYGLELRLLNPDGSTRWNKVIHVSSAVSKGHPKDGAWTREAAFSETRTFVPTDARVTQIKLPPNTPVNSSLQVRLLSPESSFAMVRAYGLTRDENRVEWIDNIAMSPREKQELVQGITYLDWNEIELEQQTQRLANTVARLTAASDVRSESKIVPLYISDYRVPRSPKPISTDRAFIPPWNETYLVDGPKKLKLTLQLNELQLNDPIALPHLLHVQRIDENGNIETDVEPFFPWQHRDNQRVEHTIEVPTGQQIIKLRWDPPETSKGAKAQIRSRRNEINVSHAKDHHEQLVYTLQEISQVQGVLGSEHWEQRPALDPSILEPTRWRSNYYYLRDEAGPLHFLVPADKESARMFKIKVADWDTTPLQSTDKALNFAFLDLDGKVIDHGTAPISQSFDRDRWVAVRGTLKGTDEAQPLMIGLGTGQSFSGIAPKGTRWIKLSSQAPLLVQTSARIPNTTSSTFKRPPTHQNTASNVRHWIPMLAKEHPAFEQKGWIMSVKSTAKPRTSTQDERDNSQFGASWKPLIANGRPALQRVLEETSLYEDDEGFHRGRVVYPSRDALWLDCARCWSEIPSNASYRVLDFPRLPNEPQSLWAIDLHSSKCSYHLDEQEHVFACPAHREKIPLVNLDSGSHTFAWRSDAPGDRLWINRPAMSGHSTYAREDARLFVERVLTKLELQGQRYKVSKSGQQAQYLNFRIYRPVEQLASGQAPLPDPLAVEVQLDAGSPRRRSGQLFSHFTPSVKRIWVMPNAAPELVFLDDDLTGPFEVFELGFRLGQDIKSGRHGVQIRAKSTTPLWVRAFEQGQGPSASSTSVFGQRRPPN